MGTKNKEDEYRKFSVRGTFLFDKSNCLYLSHLSKIIFGHPTMLQLSCVMGKLDLEYDIMLPEAAAKIFREINITDYRY